MNATPSPQDQEILKLLEALKSIKAEYPPELLANRRNSYLKRLTRTTEFGAKNQDVFDNGKIVALLENLKPVRTEYPSILKAKQRTAFLDQAAKKRKVGWFYSLHSKIQSWVRFTSKAQAGTMPDILNRVLVLVSVIAITYVGVVYGNRIQSPPTQLIRLEPTQVQIAQPASTQATATHESTKTTSCAPDATLSQCSTYGFDLDTDQATWVSKSAKSWIKIDTGQTAIINKVEFDKKRLGGSTGEFTVSVALSENEYKLVYNSKSDDSTDVDSESETVQVSFEPELARYVLITVNEPGTEINEVRAFAVNQPPSPVPSQVIRNTKEPPLPTSTASNTPLPTRTKTPTPTNTLSPTNTPLPSNTPTSTPTLTSSPSRTPTTLPTRTPSPSYTPAATSTNTHLPSNTPTSVPTSTPLPSKTPTTAPASTPLPTRTPQPANTPTPNSTP